MTNPGWNPEFLERVSKATSIPLADINNALGSSLTPCQVASLKEAKEAYNSAPEDSEERSSAIIWIVEFFARGPQSWLDTAWNKAAD